MGLESSRMHDTSKLVALNDKVQKSQAQIGEHGGRKFTYDGVASSLNDYVKELSLVVNETLTANGGFLSPEEQQLITSIKDGIGALDQQGDDALKDAKPYQKRFTYIRQFFGNFHYKRNNEIQKVENALAGALTKKQEFLTKQTEKFNTIYENYQTDEEIKGFLKQFDTPIHGPEFIPQLAKVYALSNPGFLFKNFALFGLDRSQMISLLSKMWTNPSQSIEICSCKITPNVNEAKASLHFLENLDTINLADEKEVDILSRFVGLFMRHEQRKAVENHNYTSNEQQRISQFVMQKFKDLGINPLEKNGLTLWKNFFESISPSQPYLSYMTFEYKMLHEMGIIDLSSEEGRQAYVEILKVRVYLTDLHEVDISRWTGIGTETTEDLLILKDIIKRFVESDKQNPDKIVNPFIRRNLIEKYGIYGKTEAERRFLEIITEHEHFSPKITEFSSLLGEPLINIYPMLDVPSILNLLVDNKDPRVTRPAMVALVEKHRPLPNQSSNLRDLTHSLSLYATMETIKYYGEGIYVLDLDLSQISSRPEWLIPIFKEIAEKCPNLQTLRIKGGKLNAAVCAALPQTLQTLEVSNGDIMNSDSLKSLPPNLEVLKMKNMKTLFDSMFNNLIIPDSIQILEMEKIETTSIPLHQIHEAIRLPKNLRILLSDWSASTTEIRNLQLPASLEEFSMKYLEGNVRDVMSFLPENLQNLTIKKVQNQFSLVTTEDVVAWIDRFKKLKRLDAYIAIDFTQGTTMKLPEFIKRLAVVPNGTANELMQYLPQKIEDLSLAISANGFWADIDFKLWPKNLKEFTLFSNEQDEKLSDEMVPDQQLPDQIAHVYVPKWAGTFAGLMAFLPSKIENLYLQSDNADLFKDADPQLWPQSLRSLVFHGPISEESIKTHKLPETIKEIINEGTDKTFKELLPLLPENLEVYEGVLKPGDIEHLPSTLKILKLSKYEFELFFGEAIRQESIDKIQAKGIKIEWQT